MILGIESSCDESALALFDGERGTAGNWTRTQIALHREYGGVVPDLASREHLQNFFPLLEASGVLDRAGEIDRVAVTRGPGLAACLALGIALARSLGLAWGVPVVGANHLRGHAYSPFIALHAERPSRFAETLAAELPHLGLLVSGGNSLLFEIRSGGRITVLAETVDDAAGEALDKGAKLLGLPYPGGPEIERRAAEGDSAAFDFPRAIAPRNERRFSFSGLKTSLRYRLERMGDAEVDASLNDLCASYQQAVIDQLRAKSKHLLESGAYRSFGLSGGVANNRALRAAAEDLCGRFGLPCRIAAPEHTGDNAAMIAFAAYAEPDGLAPEPFALEPALRLD